MGLPQAVHFVFSKNWSLPHRSLSQWIIIGFLQASHFSLPTKVCPLQKGQFVIKFRPHPEQTALSRLIGFKQDGQ